MTVKDFIDVKSTFETFKGIKLHIVGADIKLYSLDLLMRYYSPSKSIVDELFNFGNDIECITECINANTKGKLLNREANKESIHKEIEQYEGKANLYMLYITNIDRALEVIGDIDVYNSETYRFIWDENGFLSCVVDYNKMSNKEHEIIQRILELYYLEIASIPVSVHSYALNIAAFGIIAVVSILITLYLYVTQSDAFFDILITVSIMLFFAYRSLGVNNDLLIMTEYNELKSKYDK